MKSIAGVDPACYGDEIEGTRRVEKDALGDGRRNSDIGSQTESTSNENYWTNHNVTNHQQFASIQESLGYFDWRNDQYPGYINLMPVTGQDSRVVLDYGCGPGHDMVGFGHFSRPARLIGMDISTSSLAEARSRLALHGIPAEFIHIKESDETLPLRDGSVDYIHSSGVVHHAKEPAKILNEFRRVLSAAGTCRIMVYNYNSVWLHLYVAYVKRIKEGLYADLDIRSAFTRTTDGPNCPISRAYQSEEFIQLVQDCGFRCRFAGAAVSLFEMNLLPLRFEAAARIELPAEHRKFLLALTLDAHGLPRFNDHYAGVDGCYELTPM
jgi:ubiquinone/menaquinone biosynthesis C-methylase UbiE